MAGEDLDAARAFFAERAATWEERFPDDAPAYARAVSELAPPRGGRVLDVACGTGRALIPLRDAVGPAGQVVGIDLTPEMLAEAQRRGRGTLARLIRGDVTALPCAAGSVDAIFAAGIVQHLRDPVAGLREFARVCRAEARLALFHPIGRAALARRHDRELDPDDLMAEDHIRAALAAAGWQTLAVDDGEDRYLTLARLSS